MFKNKKITSYISLGLLVCLTSSIIVTSFALSNTQSEYKDDEINNNFYPIGREENYYHYEIVNYLSKEDIASINQLSIIDNSYVYKISEEKFLISIEKIIREALHKHNKFSNNYDKYIIELSYYIGNSISTIYIDSVWYLPNGYEVYYYDQFEIIMY